MTSITKSALVPFTPKQMYDLVNDVDSYATFLPWCSSVKVHERSEHALKATLYLTNRQSFTTQNRMTAGHRIDMNLVEGPFKSLKGTWQFQPLGPTGCQVSLEMQFELAGGLVGMAFGRVFGPLANSMVDAFCKQAAVRYGKDRP